MLAPSGELLRAGVALKLNHVKRAAQSYLRDRTSHATGRVTSYALAAGLFAAAGLFVVAAVFVGLIALYRWVAIMHGQFWGFGAAGAVLLVLAGILAGVAAAQMNRKNKPVVPLSSRLRVAIATPRIPRGTMTQAVRELATTMPFSPLAPGGGDKSLGNKSWRVRGKRPVQVGVMLAAVGLLGLAAARRRRSGQRSDA